jgi:hypothetical protein
VLLFSARQEITTDLGSESEADYVRPLR